MTKLPFVTVIMPIRNVRHYIERSLRAVMEQDYPHKLMEVIVADGMSWDGTTEITRSFQRKYPNLTLIDNPGTIVSTGMNKAIRQSRGEIIVRVDGRTIIAHDYISQCVSALNRTNADNVGGLQSSRGEGYVAEAIAIATSTPFGVGNAAFRYSSREQFTDTVFMGTFKREALFRAGLFNEDFVRHQDYELNHRIRRNGGRIFLTPDIKSTYYVRRNLWKLLSQYFQYGFWKGRMIKRYPFSLKLRHILPSLLILTLVLGIIQAAVLSAGLGMLLMAIGLYGIFVLAATIGICLRPGRIKYIISLPCVLMCSHFSYGFGVLLGLLKPGRHPKKNKECKTRGL